MAFSENLQTLRAQAGATQEQLAETLGVSRQSVSKWEGGLSFPELDTILRSWDIYEVDLDTLLRGSVADRLVGDTARYDAFMNRFSRQTALAVAAILVGVSLLIFLNAFDSSDSFQMLATALFLLILTVSVVVLVAAGIQYDHFRKRHPVLQDFYTEEEKETFHQKLVWYIAGGVGAILFGTALLVGVFAFLPEREPYESYAASGLVLLVAGAVYAFIYGGLQDEKYKIWKYNRDNNPTPEAKRRLDLIGALCGGVMLLATAIYVGASFIRDDWSDAVWLFPVAGILCGLVAVLLDPYKGED